MPQVPAYAAASATSALAPLTIDRREPGPADVAIDILYCGVCHSDLHTARNEWGITVYPAVPGHEIVGRVRAVGSGVTRHKVGDLVGVGCIVDSCRHCEPCDHGLEQYCENGFTDTYNGREQVSRAITLGGYSTAIVVDQNYVLRISHTENLAAVAPLLCAGITTYSPLRQWKVGPGQRVGIVGLGGLGHVAVKIAAAMGAEVVLFTGSPAKTADALALGAHQVVVTRDKAQMASLRASLDLILDTVAAPHSLDTYLNLLKLDGTLVLVGAPASPHPSPSVFSLVMKRRRLAGSLIGGIQETQEMLDFCATHGIVAEIETIAMAEIETAYERMLKSDVRYRFVIDMASLKPAAA